MKIEKQYKGIQARTLFPSKNNCTFSIMDNSRQTTINRKIVNDLSTNKKGQSFNNIVQRLQLITLGDNEVESDTTILNNIVFAKNINAQRGVENEKICSIDDDYSIADIKTDKREIVFVHGHGAPGLLLKGIPFKEAARIIHDKLKPAPGQYFEIRMLTCHGGEGNPNAPEFPDLNIDFVTAIVDLYGEQSNLIVSALIGAGISYGDGGKTLTPINDEESYNAWRKKSCCYVEYQERDEKLKKCIATLGKPVSKAAMQRYYDNVIACTLECFPMEFCKSMLDEAVAANQLRDAQLRVYDGSKSDTKFSQLSMSAYLKKYKG